MKRRFEIVRLIPDEWGVGCSSPIMGQGFLEHEARRLAARAFAKAGAAEYAVNLGALFVKALLKRCVDIFKLGQAHGPAPDLRLVCADCDGIARFIQRPDAF